MIRDLALARHLQQCVPSAQQLATSTWHPRRQGARSTQIDGVFVARCACGPLQIDESSRLQVGTDHDRVHICLRVPGRPETQTKRVHGGPRVVLAPPPGPIPMLTPQTLSEMAASCTGPRPQRTPFRPSADTVHLRDRARGTREPRAWREYLRSLRLDRQRWQEARLERAATDWGVYGDIVRSKKPWGDSYLTGSAALDPTLEIGKGFLQFLRRRGLDEDLRALISPLLACPGVPILGLPALRLEHQCPGASPEASAANDTLTVAAHSLVLSYRQGFLAHHVGQSGGLFGSDWSTADGDER